MVTNACPMCRKVFTTFPSKQNEWTVKYLHVFCTNKGLGRGCGWQCEVNITGHSQSSSDGCRFERVNCSNKCGLSLKSWYLSKHIDKECPHRLPASIALSLENASSLITIIVSIENSAPSFLYHVPTVVILGWFGRTWKHTKQSVH